MEPAGYVRYVGWLSDERSTSDAKRGLMISRLPLSPYRPPKVTLPTMHPRHMWRGYVHI